MNDGQTPVPTEGPPQPAAAQPQVFQPGQTINPNFSPSPGVSTPEETIASPPPNPEPESEQAPLVGIQDKQADGVRPYDGQPLITWTASEFIAHDKSASWYGVLALAGILLAGLVYLILRDPISSTVVLVCTVLFGIYAARKPRQIYYQLDETGLAIGRRNHDYREFRSFAVVDEGAFASIVFMPLKRFAPLLSVYFDPADEAAITEVLADHLPVEPRQMDLLERMLKAIRF
jgi:hypothetical protein